MIPNPDSHITGPWEYELNPDERDAQPEPELDTMLATATITLPYGRRVTLGIDADGFVVVMTNPEPSIATLLRLANGD